MDEKTLKDATFGMRVETFMRSDIGRYLIENAQRHEQEAIIGLVDTAPDDVANNTRYRNEIAIARMFGHWLHDAVMAGLAAKENMKAMEDNEE